MTSAIDTSVIDVDYPIVRRNNSSQPFRDNFGAIKTGLDTAQLEITELQNRAIPNDLTDLNITDGTNGQFLTTNGAGAFSFTTVNLALPVITEATTSRIILTADASRYIRFTASGAKLVTFDTGANFVAGQEFYIINRAASGNISLASVGVTFNEPKNSIIDLQPGDSVLVKFISATQADLLFFVNSSHLPMLNINNVFTKTQSVQPISLTYSSNITIDASTSNIFRVILTGNVTLENPINPTDGMMISVKLKQDSTGSRTITYGTKFKFSDGIPDVLSVAPNAIDFLSMCYDAVDDIWICVLQKGFA